MKLPFALASRFVAAETLEKTLPVVAELNQDGLHVTLDLLGEYVKERSVAIDATKAYVDLLDRISKAGLNCSISIKLSMVGQKIDMSFCLDNVRQVMEAAKRHDIFVRYDMEGSDITQSTLDIFEEMYPDYPDHCGVVLQAYLHRTADDIARMCELNARVRLCKGAYGEPASLAYQDMDVIRAKFVGYMQQLLTGARYPGIATHDDKLIEATKTFAREEGIPASDFEFQMLYGLRPETQKDLVAEGYNMRVYVPYGTEWLPYYSRRLRERKENVWFILSTLFKR
ncbi:MAG: proline dehydrogenase family protein [Bacteroidota bacterium]